MKMRERLAYCLATCYHETGYRMQPVRETHATSDQQAINRLEHAWKSGRLSWVKKPVLARWLVWTRRCSTHMAAQLRENGRTARR